MLVYGRNVAKEILQNPKNVKKVILQDNFDDKRTFNFSENQFKFSSFLIFIISLGEILFINLTLSFSLELGECMNKEKSLKHITI